MKKKTINSPCPVTAWLYANALSGPSPGNHSSIRNRSARIPPKQKKKSEVTM